MLKLTSRNCRYPALLERPSIVGAVADLETLEALADLPAVSDCDLLEFRLDALGSEVGAWQALLPASLSLPPALITVRDPAEGGFHGLALEDRLAHYEASLERAALIDVEIRNLEASASLVESARRQGILVVGSFHDFEKLPSPDLLDDVLRRGLDAGADAIKLAVTTATVDEVLRLTRFFLDRCQDVALAAMGMGACGKASRLLLAQAGSRLNYSYLQNANASGQWQATELRRLFSEINPPPAPGREAGPA